MAMSAPGTSGAASAASRVAPTQSGPTIRGATIAANSAPIGMPTTATSAIHGTSSHHAAEATRAGMAAPMTKPRIGGSTRFVAAATGSGGSGSAASMARTSNVLLVGSTCSIRPIQATVK